MALQHLLYCRLLVVDSQQQRQNFGANKIWNGGNASSESDKCRSPQIVAVGNHKYRAGQAGNQADSAGHPEQCPKKRQQAKRAQLGIARL